MPRLVLLSEGFTGRAYELKAQTTTVGRVSDNAFEIPEASVSSHHAEIILRGTDVVVRDLNSTNGTFISGERITEAVLKPGQILRLGTIDMRLETGEAAPKPKQALDHTRVIPPQGVKAEELYGTGSKPEFKTTGFEKKDSRGSKIFIVIAIAAGVVLVGALVWVVFLKGGP